MSNIIPLSSHHVYVRFYLKAQIVQYCTKGSKLYKNKNGKGIKRKIGVSNDISES